MTAYNRDIRPDEETLALYPMIRCLTANEQLQAEFEKFENLAAKNKRRYHLYGSSAVLLTAASAIYSAAYAAFKFSFDGLEIVSVIFAASAFAAFVLHLYVSKAKPKDGWLVSRYAAERIRSIKFQAFCLAASSATTELLESRVASFCRARVVDLNVELTNGGVGSLDAFVPGNALELDAQPGESAHPLIYDEARRAYRQLRLRYQEVFSGSQVGVLGEHKKFWRAATDWLFISGAVLVLAAITNKIFHNYLGASVEVWVEFLSVMVFILSAALAIIDNASISDRSGRRYKEYSSSLKTVRDKSDVGKLPLNAEIEATELLALRELQEFCGAVILISYRL